MTDDTLELDFGKVGVTRKGCANEQKCLSFSDQKTMMHQLCAICAMLQEILKKLEK